MKTTRTFAIVLLFMSIAQISCSLLAATEAAPAVEATTTAETTTEPTAGPSAEPSAVISAGTATTAPTAIRSTPTPTAAPLKLEVLQSQTWYDPQGNARVNVLFRNPYDFPVSLVSASAGFYNGAGDLLRAGGLSFLDGISGGFIQPGETMAAHFCPTCDEALLTEEWATVEFFTSIEAATGQLATSTEVEPSVGDVEFEGESPIFWIKGTVKNNSATALQRISVRVIVLDQAGKLVGAAEASAWDVEPGATAEVSGYGFGQTPAGPVEYQVTALGVNY